MAVLLLVAAIAVIATRTPEPGADPPTPPARSTTTTESGTTSTGPTTTVGGGVVGALVDRLVVAEPDLTLPYRRAAFADDWAYDPASGCNTRERVLIDEAIVAPTVDDRCRATNGRWRSAYDGLEVTDVAELQIDHLVPLADAWRSGAATWTPARRAAFHDDLGHPETLIAVTGRTNGSKGDSSPDEWLPPDRTAWCTYAADWVAVKATWELTVTPAEKATLVSILGGC